MIDQDEIITKASDFGIHETAVERDYVFGWLLTAIYTSTHLKDVLILKGGAAFRKAYFEKTRFTGDLDFSTEQVVDPQVLAQELNKACQIVEAMTGVRFETEKTRVDEKRLAQTKGETRLIYATRLYFHDFYGERDDILISVRMDVTELDRILLPVQTRNLIHPYSDFQDCQAQIRCLKLEELLASKLKCLLQRRSVNDLFDYVFSIFVRHEINVDRSEILHTFLEQTIFRPAPSAARKLLLGLPFEKLKDSWTKYIVVPKQVLVSFDEGLSRFKDNMHELFGPYDDRMDDLAFFPPEYRNPIMEAANSMTLLRLTYHGVTRSIEPYSLVYKRRRDGAANEYFYAYDRTGGQTSGPDLKTFLARDIENLELTEEKFEPRYPIELSKAGEPSDKGYFGKPFSNPRARTITRIRQVRSGWGRRHGNGTVYVLECGACRKTFRRNAYTTRLNEHKDKYGNRCFGRVGRIIDQNRT